MSGDDRQVTEYLSKNRRRYVYMVIVTLMTMAIAVFSFGKGSLVIDLDDAFDVIANRLGGNIPDRYIDGYWEWLKDRLIFEGTIPRAFGAILVGAILGIGGAVMQICVRNPLADPYTTGISSASLFGVAIYLVFGFTIIPGSGEDGLLFNAFVFAMVPCVVMSILAIRSSITPTKLILIGIGIMYIFTAFTMVMKYNAEPEIIEQIYHWSIGSVSGVRWYGVWWLIAAACVLFVTMFMISRKLDVMMTGENLAHSLGVNTVRVRMVSMVIVSACTSVAVCFSGSIGFVGLIVPHISRLLVGSRTNLLLPCSAVTGSLLLMSADVVSRMMSTNLPVGAVTAVIGAPLFLFFLIRMRTSGWGR